MTRKQQKRNRRGGVSVTPRYGMLRLRWSWDGKQRQLSLRLKDTPENRLVAQRTADMIAADLAAGTYDPTLYKYRAGGLDDSQPEETDLSTIELFEQFIEVRRIEGTSGQTIASKYRAMLSNLKRFDSDIKTPLQARDFIDVLCDRQSPRTVNQNLVLLKSFGRWLVQLGHLSVNPFDVIRPVRGGARKVQDRTPFSREEVAKLLETMRQHPFASHYYDYTVVLFSLGLRPSEAIGLRWGHIDLAERKILICESLSRSADGLTAGYARQRQGTKTDNARVLPLNDKLVKLFRDRKPNHAQPDDLIFTTAKGLPIDDHNYRERYWKPTCERAGIRYRPPYTTRHTLLSYGIEYEGWTLAQAAYIAGHSDTDMVSRTYGHLLDMPKLPDF